MVPVDAFISLETQFQSEINESCVRNMNSEIQDLRDSGVNCFLNPTAGHSLSGKSLKKKVMKTFIWPHASALILSTVLAQPLLPVH